MEVHSACTKRSEILSEFLMILTWKINLNPETPAFDPSSLWNFEKKVICEYNLFT